MKTHWTERSLKDYIFRIAADFIVQLEDKMELLPLSRGALAKKMKKTKGWVSQVFNNPGNLKIHTIVEYSRALNMKVAIVAYEDNDPKNEKGPINSEIFKICWEKAGKPRDFWAFQEASEEIQRAQMTDKDQRRQLPYRAILNYFSLTETSQKRSDINEYIPSWKTQEQTQTGETIHENSLC